jgi:hypothetical protein
MPALRQEAKLHPAAKAGLRTFLRSINSGSAFSAVALTTPLISFGPLG